MGLIFNATNEEQSVKALGNWFTLKPKQIKMFQDNISNFLGSERRDNGLICLPESFEDPEYKVSPEGKAELARLEDEGISHYVNALRARIYNNQVSLRQDLEKANMKIDPSMLATDADLEAMRLVAKYQQKQDDSAQKRVDEVKELMKQVGHVKK